MEYLTATLIAISFLTCYCNAINCRYNDLEKSLVNTEENLYKLSQAFFPPVENPPEFVTVCYYFPELDQNKTWYWSVFTSSFIHPPEVLQYISLFFTKPHYFYNGTVQLILNDTALEKVANCADDLLRMQLLTQRLQLYASQQSKPIKVDANYKAKAFISYEENSKNRKISKDHKIRVTVEDSINNDLDDMINTTTVFILVLTTILIVIILFLYVLSKPSPKDWDNAVESKIPLVCALAVLSLPVILYNFLLSILAIATWNASRSFPYYKIYTKKETRNLGPVAVIITTDSICLIVYFLIIAWAAGSYCRNTSHTDTGNERFGMKTFGSNQSDPSNTDNSVGTQSAIRPTTPPKKSEKVKEFLCSRPWYVVLSLTVICPIVSIISNTPYIAIAFLDDAHHAGSMFIYYTIVVCIAYSISWIAFHSLKSTLISCKSTCNSWKQHSCKDNCRTICPTVCIVGLGTAGLITFLVMVIIATIYFIIIPINKSISDAPNRLVGIYQSGGFLIGAFVIYKLIGFFYYTKLNMLEKAVIKWETPLNDKNSRKPWLTMTDKEKLDHFYTEIIHTFSVHLKKVVETEEEQESGATANEEDETETRT